MELVILEVSQKQAYIFGSTRLIDNVLRSGNIRKVTENAFLKQAWHEYDPDQNLLYNGGGHIILHFDTAEKARKFVQAVTRRAWEDFDGMELFAKCMPYDESLTPGENIAALQAALEKKKSFRQSAFRFQGTGLERGLVSLNNTPNRPAAPVVSINGHHYKEPSDFGTLSGKDGWIAVVHIDGNNMGAKVKEIEQKADGKFEDAVPLYQTFSQGIEDAYQHALERTRMLIAAQQAAGRFAKIGFSPDGDVLPYRRIISAGDDITFVTAGSIGMECANAFLEFLQNPDADAGQKQFASYSACAGVCIVHKKYPFHRAYDLAEGLCSSAKRYAAQIGQGKSEAEKAAISALDWHIEFGQDQGSVSDIRRTYLTDDSGSGETSDDPICTLTLRPLTVAPGDQVFRSYGYFRRLFRDISQLEKTELPRSKVKGLREAIKRGEAETEHFILQNQISDIEKRAYDAYFAAKKDAWKDMAEKSAAGEAIRAEMIALAEAESIFHPDGSESTKYYHRSLYFDAIEMLDHLILFEEG